MLYTGIDYHKRYSVASAQEATGTRICEARVDENERVFAAYFARLLEPSCVVVVACWIWGWLYDELGEIEGPTARVICLLFSSHNLRIRNAVT